MMHELTVRVTYDADRYTDYSVECSCGYVFQTYRLKTPSTVWCDPWVMEAHANHWANEVGLPPNWLELIDDAA